MARTVSELLPLPELPELERETSQLSRLLEQQSEPLISKTEALSQRLSTYFFHSEHAEFRLKGIYNKYQLAHACYAEIVDDLDEREYASGDLQGLSESIIWDFQAFLSSLTTAVNVLQEVAVHFYSKVNLAVASSEDDLNPMQLFAEADKRWIRKLKDYHQLTQTQPLFDSEDNIGVCRYADGWELRIKLPANPENSNQESFRFSRRTEVLRFALHVFRGWRALDGAFYRCLKGLNPR